MSSTWIAVTGSQDPYIFDLPHVLSLPPGFESRFRYRHKWVAQDVHAKLKKDAKSFYTEELILCFHSQELQRVIPIRKCQVVSVEEIGHVIFLRFSVGAFPLLERISPESSDPEPSATALNKLAAQGRALLGIDAEANLSQPLPLGHYFRKAAALPSISWCEVPEKEDGDDPAKQTALLRAWASLVAALGAEPRLHGVPLFHLLGFDRENGARVSSQPIKSPFSSSKVPIHGFELTEGERYRLRLLEWCDHKKGEPQPAFRVDCELANVGLALEGASNLVVGRYDVLEYTLVGEHPGYGEILVRAEALEATADPQTATDAAPPADAGEGDSTEEDKDREPSLQHPKQGTTSPATPVGRQWPSVYRVRIPVSVALPLWKFIGLGALVPVGLSIYLWFAPTCTSPLKEFAQIVGLLLLTPFARHIEKVFKLREGMKKWNELPKVGKD
jgi:hypothetical protein